MSRRPTPSERCIARLEKARGGKSNGVAHFRSERSHRGEMARNVAWPSTIALSTYRGEVIIACIVGISRVSNRKASRFQWCEARGVKCARACRLSLAGIDFGGVVPRVIVEPIEHCRRASEAQAKIFLISRGRARGEASSVQRRLLPRRLASSPCTS